MAKELTAKQRQSAQRVAEDLMTDEAIAAEAGVTRQSLHSWRKRDDFKQLVDEHRALLEEESRKYGVATVASQLRRLNDHRKALLAVIEGRARASHGPDARIQGTSTGLVVVTKKSVGKGRKQLLVEEFTVDGGILAELRAIELQALKISGQLKEHVDVTTAGKALDLFGLSSLSDEELNERLAKAEERKTPPPVPS